MSHSLVLNGNQFSVIAFDVFGTLVKIGKRRSPYQKLMKYFKDQGRQPHSSDAAMIMSNNVDFVQLAATVGMHIPDQLLQELINDLDDELQSIELYEDTISTLEQLRKLGFKLALCSNLAKPYGEAVFPLLPNFDAYAWSYEVGAIKPDPKIYQSLIDQLACQAGDVLFIGDTPLADVTGPTTFGMSARLINRKNGQTLNDIFK